MKWYNRRITRETGAGEATGGEAAGEAQPKTFTQEQVDAILKQRLEREGVKRQELDELRSWKEQQEKLRQEQEQVDLEKKQQYDKIKEQFTTEKQTLQEALSQKDQAINNLQIDNALTLAVMQNDLYPEAKDLLKGKAEIKDGQVMIKMKVNNIDTLVSVEDGVKAFREAKPYLAKASNQGGGGTPPSGQGGQGAGETKPLAQQLQEARAAGDTKRANDIKQQIRQSWAASGISTTI